jgi:predicted esterase
METLRSDLTLKAEISLYYDVYVPENLEMPAPLLIAVHGYGQHKGWIMREARAIAGDKFVIAALQGPHQHFQQSGERYRTGFAWLTDHKPEEYIRLHHKFLLDVIDRLAAEQLIDRSRVFLFGYSQASALNFRFAFTHPNILRGLIAACGGIPGDLDTNPIYQPFQAETFYLFGSDDEFYPKEKFLEFDQKLTSRLPNYRSKLYNAKHEITDEMRQDMRRFLSRLV